MKTTLFYLAAFFALTFGISKFLGSEGKTFGPFQQSRDKLDNITSDHLREVLPGAWSLEISIINEEEELEINGEISHQEDGSFNLYYTINGTDPRFGEFGNHLTAGGRLQGYWHINDSMATWEYQLTACTFDFSYYEYPYSYFDLCLWFDEDVGLSFGNQENDLGRQFFTHFSTSRITLEERRFSESGTRTFTFIKND
jgi:hypothetical protein